MRKLDFALRCLALFSALSLGPWSLAGCAPPPAPSLAGAWMLSAADDLLPDGSRVKAYGERPEGFLILTPEGRYSLQIFRTDRPHFASGNKRRGTAAEYEAAVLGMSSHIGRYAVDPAGKIITFYVERASYPNWDGAEQKRPFELVGDELSYRVPLTPDGITPLSVWRRAR